MQIQRITNFIIITLILAGTLTNSGLFVYQTLAAYFLFTLIATVFVFKTGVFSLFKKVSGIYFGIESVLFLAWVGFISITALLSMGGVIRGIIIS